MADLPKNVFQMLDDENLAAAGDAANKLSTKTQTNTEGAVVEQPTSEAGSGTGNVKKSSDSNDDNWTVQQSTRTRRLAPQFTLTKMDLGTESPRSRSQVTDKEKFEKERIERDQKDSLKDPIIREVRNDREKEPIKKKGALKKTKLFYFVPSMFQTAFNLTHFM
jgi:hypothetical protein